MSRPIRVDFGRSDSSHVDQRCELRKFNRAHIAQALNSGIVIEFTERVDGATVAVNTKGKPFTRLADWKYKGKAVVMATVFNRPVHVVVIVNALTTILEVSTVTVYEPKAELWDETRTRRIRQEVTA